MPERKCFVANCSLPAWLYSVRGKQRRGLTACVNHAEMFAQQMDCTVRLVRADKPKCYKCGAQNLHKIHKTTLTICGDCYYVKRLVANRWVAVDDDPEWRVERQRLGFA